MYSLTSGGWWSSYRRNQKDKDKFEVGDIVTIGLIYHFKVKKRPQFLFRQGEHDLDLFKLSSLDYKNTKKKNK